MGGAQGAFLRERGIRARKRSEVLLLALTVVILAFVCLFAGSSHMTAAD